MQELLAKKAHSRSTCVLALTLVPTAGVLGAIPSGSAFAASTATKSGPSDPFPYGHLSIGTAGTRHSVDVALPDKKLVEEELRSPGLSPKKRAYLESVPTDVLVSAQADTSSAADPTAQGGCTETTALGIQDWSFEAYQGFSVDNGKVTQVAAPTVQESSLPLVWTYEGSSTVEAPTPAVPATSTQEEIAGTFGAVAGIVGTETCDVTFTLNGSGSWTESYQIT